MTLNTKYAGPCLYRAYTLKDARWIYGQYVNIPAEKNILNHSHFIVERGKEGGTAINEYTLCAWTGRTYRNGKKIFAGDIVVDKKGQYGVVKLIEYEWGIEWRMYDGELSTDSYFGEHMEYTGKNVFDNPELLEKETNDKSRL